MSIAATSERNVAEEIVANDDVVLLGIAHQLHRAIVGEHVFEGDVREFRPVHGGDDLLPQHAGFHHVVLFRRGHLVAALARQIEGDAGNSLDLAGGVELGVDGPLLAVLEGDDLLRLTEIDATGELAHDQDVEILDQLALE